MHGHEFRLCRRRVTVLVLRTKREHIGRWLGCRTDVGGTSDARAFPGGQVRVEGSHRHKARAVEDRSPREFSAFCRVSSRWGRFEFALRSEAGSSQRRRTGSRLHEGSATAHHASKTGSLGEDGDREELLLGVAGHSHTFFDPSFDIIDSKDRYGFHIVTPLQGSHATAALWTKRSSSSIVFAFDDSDSENRYPGPRRGPGKASSPNANGRFGSGHLVTANTSRGLGQSK